MTAEQALPLLREEIASLEASGEAWRPDEWSLVVCSCTQAEGMLVAVALGTRLAHAPGAFPCGMFLLAQVPTDG